MKKKKIIYIMSDVRSGSTLLENILSKSDEIISVGELKHLESHINKGSVGKLWDWNCSCGSGINECNFWGNVLLHLEKEGVNSVIDTKILYSKSLKDYLFFNKKIKKLIIKNNRIIWFIDKLYDSIFEVSGNYIIVDSSKDPIQGLLLYKQSNFDVNFVYLKRDIRSVVLSKHKWNKKINTKLKGINANKYKLLLSSKHYNYLCVKSLSMVDDTHKIFIDYEGLAKDPQSVINLITNKFSIKSIDVPKYMSIENAHSIGGTPNRFQKRRIKYDSSWELIVEKKKIFSFIGKFIDKL